MSAFMLNGSLAEFLSSPWIILAVVVLIFGIAMAMLSRPISERISKKELDKNSKEYKKVIIVSLIIIFVGILLFMIGTAVLAGLF